MLLDPEHLGPVLIVLMHFFDLTESVRFLLLLKSWFVTQQKVDLRDAALLPSAAAELNFFLVFFTKLREFSLSKCLQEIKSTFTSAKPGGAI